MHKKDLIKLAGISEYTLKKLSRNESVSIEVLCKISKALGCSLEEIFDVIEE